MVKDRESFRPFAPAVLVERTAAYFELDRESPYMLLVLPVRSERRRQPAHNAAAGEPDLAAILANPRSDIPAGTQLGFSAPGQTGHPAAQAGIPAILKAFRDFAGCPLPL